MLVGCGGSANNTTQTSRAAVSGTGPGSTPPPVTTASAPAVDDLSGAEHPSASEFPPAAGRSLEELAKLIRSTAQLGAATGTNAPGTNRFAFALTDAQERFVYAPTAVYVASSLRSAATGPHLAAADPMGVAPRYRSAQNAAPGELKAIYGTELRFRGPGLYYVLAVTRVGSRLIGSTGAIAVAAHTPIPAVGQRPPAISTETLASVHGDVALLTTRTPPENMHSVSFAQVLGRRPIALLVSTPELCTSRVCGPVTDILVSLQHQFPAITFIHQEVYVDNQPTKGLRPQLKAFHLETEPWLFTINRQGRIVARVEGAFGVNTARRALEAALS